MVLDHFISRNGIILNKNAEIKYTEKSGYGVYINVRDLVAHDNSITEARYEIMRIPQDAVLNVPKCVELALLLNAELQQVINGFIRHFITEVNRLPSETLILTIYVTFFVVFQKVDDTIDAKIGDYLKILQDTKIETPLLELVQGKDVDDYYKASPNENWETSENSINLTNLINKSIPSQFTKISLEDFVHLSIVIRSRVLEIPQLVPDSQQDEFTVNTTLVPILDFVNHDNVLQNSWFDVDRENNDVLLIYEFKESQKNEEYLQLYISYSPIEDIRRFSFIYGFIPQSSSIKTIELAIDRTYLQENHQLNYNFCKRFKISPNLQFVVHLEQNEIRFDALNLSNNLMFLSFLDGLKMLVDKTGTKFEYKNVEIDDSIKLLESLEEEEVSASLLRFVSFVREYSEFKLAHLNKLCRRKDDDHLISLQLIEFEKKTIDSYVITYDEIDDKLQLIEFDEQFDEYKMKNQYIV